MRLRPAFEYFRRRNYGRIDGKPYFSFYGLNIRIGNVGSIEATRAALDRFRARAKAASLPGLHLNAVISKIIVLPPKNTMG